MAKAKFDIKDLKTEAARSLHAGVGAADLALEAVKEYVADVQKRLEAAQKSVSDFDFQPKALRSQATTVVSTRVDELSKEAKARRTAVEKRVAELQTEAQKLVAGNLETVTDTYGDLAKRGETVVRNFRRKPATKQTVANAKTTAAKAKTTTTQAKKSAAKTPPSRAPRPPAPRPKTVKSATQAVSS